MRVFVYKNIIQSSNSACIPELQLAVFSFVTQSTSTAYQGNTSEQNNKNFTLNFIMHNEQQKQQQKTGDFFLPWHLFSQAEPNVDDNIETKVRLPDMSYKCP